jgi:hypothetical protein
MESTSPVLRRLEARCARLNDGLAAVAIVLAIVIGVVACEQRLSEIVSLFQPIAPETGVSMLSY